MRDDLPSTLPSDVKKASEVVNAKSVGSEFTVLDRKLFNILLGHAYRNLQTNKTHRIALDELTGLFFGSGRSLPIRESLERLWNQKIAIDYVDDEGIKHEMRCHYLSFDMSHFEGGYIIYAFDPLLMKFLRNPKVYSQIQLNTVRKFRTNHALKLYEQMRMVFSRFRPVFTCTVEEAHEFFEIPADSVYRKRPDAFRARVIEPAVSQVNELAEFDVGVEYDRAGQGNRFVGMTFNAQPKTAKRMLIAADASAPAKRRRDGQTLDMFKGVTDDEISARPTLRADSLEQARRIVGPDADLDALLETWSGEFGAKGVLSLQSNESFLSWLSLRAARDTDPELAGLDVDAFYDSMMGAD